MREKLDKNEYSEYQKLKVELEEFGFYEEVEDQFFKLFLAEMSKNELMQKVEYSNDEKLLLKEESKKAVERVLQKIKAQKK